MLNVYLCSRVAVEARPVNDRVAASLKANGFSVYVPHVECHNNPTDGRYDKDEIWRRDFAAMAQADVFVVVGKSGKDMSFEIGWAYAQRIPLFFVPAGDETFKDSPMILPALTRYSPLDIDAAGFQLLNQLKGEWR